MTIDELLGALCAGGYEFRLVRGRILYQFTLAGGPDQRLVDLCQEMRQRKGEVTEYLRANGNHLMAWNGNPETYRGPITFDNGGAKVTLGSAYMRPPDPEAPKTPAQQELDVILGRTPKEEK